MANFDGAPPVGTKKGRRISPPALFLVRMRSRLGLDLFLDHHRAAVLALGRDVAVDEFQMMIEIGAASFLRMPALMMRM